MDEKFFLIFDYDKTLVDEKNLLVSGAEYVLREAQEYGKVYLLSWNPYSMEYLLDKGLCKYFSGFFTASTKIKKSEMASKGLCLDLGSCVIFDDQQKVIDDFKSVGARAYQVDYLDLVKAFREFTGDVNQSLC